MSIEDQTNKENVLFKIILVGPPAVGKTCILQNYIKKDFSTDYNVTIGVEFSSKTVQIDGKTNVKLQIWDTAGQESFRSIIKSFYKKAAAVFLVYNISNNESFKQIDFWLKEAKENSLESAVFILVGNQCDKSMEEREVQYEEGLNFMKSRGLDLFFETSAKNGENIENAFTETAKLILLKFVNSELLKNIGSGSPVSNGKKGLKKTKGGCC